ncbi:DUF4148 domain-containing protein [Pararobbsia silviterrae]|uniref:DUF4148 domain-containing protein n=1 Tax=Pararobbsia silviterrae TaxID=1792498 RepID=A0A494XJE1_9BURK|nr:DUF4148 domain-containing protein [Pararobbsia silviterrae]RKP47683.1 DUF4148 domain-containing protein [Pararobbsia silviterrae]
MKLTISVLALAGLCSVSVAAFADSNAPTLTRSEVNEQLKQAFLHDTRAVDEANSYPDPDIDRRYVAKLRQKAFGPALASQ